MITFIMSEDHQYTIREVLETRKNVLQGGIIIMSYRDFISFDRLPASDFIFVDIDRLDPALLKAAHFRMECLRAAASDLKLLNPPRPDLARLEVMRRLHDRGINQFRVMSASRLGSALRFPVFLRRLDDHEGPITELLETEAALADALTRFIESGVPRDAIAVAEYVDARNPDGVHEKRSYFRIGETFFPTELMASTHWICKVDGDKNAVDTTDREMQFLNGHEDVAILQKAFEAAEIDYGRADYAIVNGRPQIFEINTNPMIFRPESQPPALRPCSETVLARWLEALAVFSPPRPGQAPRWIAVDGAVEPPAAPVGYLLRRTVRRLLASTGQLHRETTIMRPLRSLGIAR